jgi:hypothetical protein
MTWALAKLCKLFAIGMNLRNSLKILKGMSTTTVVPGDSDSSSLPSSPSLHPSPPPPPHLCITTTGRSILMFWSIFALITIWEQYLERFFQWIPLYFYCKSLFILLMAFPKLKFTNNIFHQYLIPFFEWIHDHYEHLTVYDWKEFLMRLPFDLFFLFFPFHLEVKYPSDRSSSSSTLILTSSPSASYTVVDDVEDNYDLSIPLYDDDDDDNLEKVEVDVKLTRMEMKEMNAKRDEDQEDGAKTTNPFDAEEDIPPHSITLRKKYVPVSTAATIPKRSAVPDSKDDDSFTSPIPTRKSALPRSGSTSEAKTSPGSDHHELSAEKVSPMLNGFRQVELWVDLYLNSFLIVSLLPPLTLPLVIASDWGLECQATGQHLQLRCLFSEPKHSLSPATLHHPAHFRESQSHCQSLARRTTASSLTSFSEGYHFINNHLP